MKPPLPNTNPAVRAKMSQLSCCAVRYHMYKSFLCCWYHSGSFLHLQLSAQSFSPSNKAVRQYLYTCNCTWLWENCLLTIHSQCFAKDSINYVFQKKEKGEGISRVPGEYGPGWQCHRLHLSHFSLACILWNPLVKLHARHRKEKQVVKKKNSQQISHFHFSFTKDRKIQKPVPATKLLS